MGEYFVIPEKVFVPYQLLQILDTEKAGYCFFDYKFASTHGGPDPAHYVKVYDDILVQEEKADEQAILDKMFVKFNLHRPNDFYGHSLSMSDIVLFEVSGNAYYCDVIGWKLLPEFGKQWMQMPLLEQVNKIEASNAHNARFAAAKICNSSCKAPFNCPIPHSNKRTSKGECPLACYLNKKNDRIRKMMSVYSKKDLSARDCCTLCNACSSSSYGVEQGQIVVYINKNPRICGKCPVPCEAPTLE